MSLLIILNPVSGRSRGISKREQLEELLRRHAQDHEWRITETTAPGEARHLAAHGAREGYSCIAAAGGDGTLSEVLNGLLSVEYEGALGVIPVGTGNDFARCAGIGTDLELAIKTLVRGEARLIDVGRATLSGASHYFLNICGCGFDALVAERINEARHHPIRRLLKGTPAYVLALLGQMAELKAACLRMDLDGEVVEEPSLLCAIANSTSYGGGMKVAPDASVHDGIFDICTIRDASRLEFLRAFPSVFAGEHVNHPKVSMRKARKIKVASQPPLPVLVDGDVRGFTPAEFEILPSRIHFLFPAEGSKK